MKITEEFALIREVVVLLRLGDSGSDDHQHYETDNGDSPYVKGAFPHSGFFLAVKKKMKMKRKRKRKRQGGLDFRYVLWELGLRFQLSASEHLE